MHFYFFLSAFLIFGFRTYRVTHSIEGTKLTFSSNNGSRTHYINRTWTGKVKINVFFDSNHYYGKVSNEATLSLETIESAKKKAMQEKKRIEKVIKEIQEEMYE